MEYDSKEIKAKPKFNVGDKVFMIEDGFVEDRIITTIVRNKNGSDYYGFDRFVSNTDSVRVFDLTQEFRLFRTKQALIKSL